MITFGFTLYPDLRPMCMTEPLLCYLFIPIHSQLDVT